jgi:hypothetical protein
MDNFLFILKFLGGIILLFTLREVVGHLLKLDKYLEDKSFDYNEAIQRFHNKDEQDGNSQNL